MNNFASEELSKSDLSKQYNNIGPQYTAGQAMYYSKVDDQATQFIHESISSLIGKSILDLGCGEGNDLTKYLDQGAKEVFGIDSSEFMVNKAREKSLQPENIFISSIESTTLKNQSMDVVVSRYALHYLSKFQKTFQEVAMILKDDGKFIFVAHHPIRDLMHQKDKTYGNQEIVTTRLFDNKVPIQFPTHTLSDYLSPEFFKHFELVRLIEGEVADDAENNSFILPGFIGISARKKGVTK